VTSPPSRLRALVELFALCGFAVTQPLLDVFGRAPDQFVFRGADDRQIIVFALVVALLPTLVLWAGELLVGAVSERARTIVHHVLVAGLVAVVVVQAARAVGSGAALFLAALIAGALAAVVYHRFSATRLWLRYAALAPIGFVALFLVLSPTSRLLGAEPGVAEVEVENPVPVVVVVLDELPLETLLDGAGNVDAELFPSFAALASDAHWFRDATTVSSSTWHAVPAIDTGNLPEDGGAPILADHPENLFTLLGGEYHLNVTESIARLCPPSVCDVEPTPSALRPLGEDALQVLRDRLSWSGDTSDAVEGLVAEESVDADFGDFELDQPDRFRALLDGLSTDPRTLSYLHILLPHVPFRYLPSGLQYGDRPSPDFGRIGETDMWEDQEWPTVLGRQRHVLQAQYVDALLGELFDRLRELDAYDDSLVIVTADHGISFTPGGPIRSIEGQALTPTSTPDLLWVPMFVKEPGQTDGEVSDANVLTIDVVPTIADVLDIDMPWEVDGRSVFGVPRATDDKPWRGSDVGVGVAVTDEVTVDGAGGLAAVRERSISGFVGPPGDPYRLYRVGPRPELVGQRAIDVAAPWEPIDLELNDPSLFGRPPSPGTAPALVRAHGDLRDGDEIAVVVDGVVAATGVAFEEGGRPEVAVMVPEALVEDGADQIDFYRL
jgi:Sulfatase